MSYDLGADILKQQGSHNSIKCFLVPGLICKGVTGSTACCGQIIAQHLLFILFSGIFFFVYFKPHP